MSTDGFNSASQSAPSSSAPQFGAQTPTPPKCSVRGCSQLLLPGATNKMCEGCRGRHRIYATTKRARRKLEKASVLDMGRVEGQLKNSGAAVSSTGNPEWTAYPSTTAVSEAATTTTTAATISPTTTWDGNAIDPQLFSNPPSVSTAHMQNLVPAFSHPPYPASSSSELAGALTLPASSSNNVQTIYDAGEDRDDESESESDSNDEDEQEVLTSLRPVDGEPSVLPTKVQGTNITDPAALKQMGPLRICSVKGCKATIPASYAFKMCPPCRTRYRTYGNTKRAKWKAEREAFDHELTILRVKEDGRRRQAGERPLSESPEELRAWEFSIINEELPLPNDRQTTTLADGTVTSGATDSSSSSTGSLAVALPLPAHMCTVSHCHKILPGSYRYKRCDQHRLQNRYHSKRKRRREKVMKQAAPGNEAEAGSDESGDSEQEPKEGEVGEEDEGANVANKAEDGTSVVDGRQDEGNGKQRGKLYRRSFTCAMDNCQNLMLPGVRWRNCEHCRARERVLRRERKESREDAIQGTEQLRVPAQSIEADVIPVLQANAGTILELEKMIQGDPRTEEEPGIIQRDIPTTGHDLLLPTKTNPIENTAIVPIYTSASTSATVQATPGPSAVINNITSANPSFSFKVYTKKVPRTFQSVFRATPDPKTPTPASPNVQVDAIGEATTPPVTTIINWATSNLPLTFREYKPKTGSPLTANRTLTQNPDLSVQILKNLLLPQRNQENNGLVDASSYHVFKSTPQALPRDQLVFVPMVPTSPPYVHQPSAKKARTDFKVAVAEYSSGGEKSENKSPEQASMSTPFNATSISDADASVVSSVKIPTNIPAKVPANTDSLVSTDTSTHTPADMAGLNSEASQTEISSCVSTSPPTVVIPRQRRPPGSRPKKTPAPKTALPPAAYPYVPPIVPPQYPQPYYIPPYGMPSYSIPKPTPTSSSTVSAVPYHPASYQYPYQPYGYSHQPYSAAPGLPGYGYLPAQYPPYGQPLPPQLQPYGPTYGYSRDSQFMYYHPPPVEPISAEFKQGKRKRDGKERLRSPTGVVTESHPAQPTDGSSVRAEPIPTQASNGQVATSRVTSSDKADGREREVARSLYRPCGNKTCRRTIPTNVTSTLCERCRTRIKKHQAKTRQRYKLEPRKPVLETARAASINSGKEGLSTGVRIETSAPVV